MKQLFLKIHNRRGDTLIEALVALVIVVLALSLLSTALSTSARINRKNNDQVRTLSVIGGGIAAAADSEGLTIQTAGIDNLVYNGSSQGGNVQITVVKDGETLDPANYTLQFNTTDNDANWSSSAPGVKDVNNPLTVQVKITLSDGAEYLKSYKLSVQKRHVTLTSDSGTTSRASAEAMDGGFSVKSVTVGGDGFAPGEGAEYKNFSTRSTVGRQANSFTYELIGNTQESNYSIDTKYGTLTVLEAGGLSCTVPSELTYTYDGTAKGPVPGDGDSDIQVYYQGDDDTSARKLGTDEFIVSYSIDYGTSWQSELTLKDPGVTELAIKVQASTYGKTVTATLVRIVKATPTLTPGSLLAEIGKKLSDYTPPLTGSSVPGTLSWDKPYSEIPEGGGTYTATFTPEDTTHYEIVKNVQITVQTILTPTVTWPTAGDITYGQTLSAVNLSDGSASAGGSEIAGSFVWDVTEPDKTIPNAGKQSYAMKFVPNDQTLYATVTGGTVTVTVNKADPEKPTNVTANAATQDEPLRTSTFTAQTLQLKNSKNSSLDAQGTLSWKAPTTVCEGYGSKTYKAVWTPTSEYSANYNSVEFDVTITVNKSDLQKAIDQYKTEINVYKNKTYTTLSVTYRKKTGNNNEEDLISCTFNGTTYLCTKGSYRVDQGCDGKTDYYCWLRMTPDSLAEKFNNFADIRTISAPSTETENNYFMSTIESAIAAKFENTTFAQTIYYTPEGGNAVKVSLSLKNDEIVAEFYKNNQDTTPAQTISYKISYSTSRENTPNVSSQNVYGWEISGLGTSQVGNDVSNYTSWSNYTENDDEYQKIYVNIKPYISLRTKYTYSLTQAS